MRLLTWSNTTRYGILLRVCGYGRSSLMRCVVVLCVICESDGGRTMRCVTLLFRCPFLFRAYCVWCEYIRLACRIDRRWLLFECDLSTRWLLVAYWVSFWVHWLFFLNYYIRSSCFLFSCKTKIYRYNDLVMLVKRTHILRIIVHHPHSLECNLS